MREAVGFTKICKLKNGQTLIIREAEVGDATEIINFVNQISGETEYLTFGEGEFEINEAEEVEFIKSISKSSNGLMICAFLGNTGSSLQKPSANTAGS